MEQLAFELSKRKGKPIGLNSRLQQAQSSLLCSGNVMVSRKNPNRYAFLKSQCMIWCIILETAIPGQPS